MTTLKTKSDETSDEPPQEGGDGKRPAHLVSYFVAKDTFIQASVWARDVANGNTSFTVHDVTLRKRAKVGGEWKSYYTFRGSEIPFLVRALDRAEEWILEQKRTENVPPF